jgi:N-methylhydantoinase A/oxoprolinase/acetone carboxylase beta subunit
MIRIGVDVGGTNTDAVVMDGAQVLAGVKVATTADVMSGVVAALKAVLAEAALKPSAIDVVMIGTTHFTNAVVQRRDLAQTAAIRLGLPATASLPPMVDWPGDLKAAIGGQYYMAHGGHEFDGREISTLDENELLGIAEDIRAKGIRAAAISSVFSPVNTECETKARDILQKALPDVQFTLSSDIGRIGLLERENAAIMNACLCDLARLVVDALRTALDACGVKARFFLTQNDGTLMDAAYAERFPVLTFASGPTNSIRGAAFLSGVSEAIVVDIGGTTSDVGSLHKGFPRPATVAVEVGGVRTNFRMPDVFSMGLGGGSLVVDGPKGVTVGPRSVGYKLVTEALVFGGSTLTTTDVVVAGGLASLGDPAKVAKLTPDLISRTEARIADMLETAVERSRLSPEPLPVIVVGGGSILVRGKIGGLEVVKPNHFAVANAVGAAIAQVSGEIDRVYSLAAMSRTEAIKDAQEKATAIAVSAGARSDSIEVVDVEDVPLAYLPGNATRVHVKVVGDLDVA